MNQNIRLAANVDANGIVRYINRDYTHWLGYDSAEILGQPTSKLRAADLPPIIQTVIGEQMRKNQPVQFPVHEVKKNGQAYWADMAIQPIFEHGAYIGYTSVKRLIEDPEEIARAEKLYRDIASGKLTYTNGDWVSHTKHQWMSRLGLQNRSLLFKTLGALFLVAVLILLSAFIKEQAEIYQIETTSAQTRAQNLVALVEAKMQQKADIGVTNAIGITFSDSIKGLIAEENVPELLAILASSGQSYAQYTGLKNINLHVINENGQSFLKSWLPLNKQPQDDLSERSYVKKMQKEQTPFVTYALTSAGFNIKSIVPVVYQGQYQGFVEFIQGVASLRVDFKATNQQYLIAMSVDYALKGDEFSQKNANNIPISNDKKWVVGNDKQFSMDVSGAQIELLRQLPLDTLFKQGYLVSQQHYHVASPVYDSANELMGYHIITEPIDAYATYVNAQVDVAKDAFYQVGLTIIVLTILVALLVWGMIIHPLRKVQSTILCAVESSDLFARVRHYSKDEIGKLGSAYNQQAMLSQCMVAEANAAMEELEEGRLDYRIKTPFAADFNLLKGRINRTSEVLHTTFESISETMHALEQGNFSAQISHALPGAYANAIDTCVAAMGQLSVAFSEVNQVMQFAARGKLDERVHTVQAGDIARLQHSINDSLSLIQKGFNDVILASERMANGDFSQDIGASYEFALDQAKQAINNSMHSLTRTLSDIKQVAHEVNDNAQSVGEGTQNLNNRTQEQAASLEETSAAMEQTTAQIQSNLANTQVAAGIAQTQVSMLAQANALMVDTKDSMNNIKTASDQIRDITGLIDSIAFQTNLLALNAAVEAARAGEHGRGFAVVASEVRNLAGKSADATKQISQLIETTTQAINVGVVQVEKVANSIGQISDETQKMRNLVDEIERASQEQAHGVAEVNKAITQIDGVTQQNAALVEETTAATEGLQASAQALQQSVSSFKLQATLR
jgi:methyl-accepting chemotaxis protein